MALKTEGKSLKDVTIQYTIEREFLSRITIKELLRRIIQSHAANSTKSEAAGG